MKIHYQIINYFPSSFIFSKVQKYAICIQCQVWFVFQMKGYEKTYFYISLCHIWLITAGFPYANSTSICTLTTVLLGPKNIKQNINGTHSCSSITLVNAFYISQCYLTAFTLENQPLSM